ncbi:6377_t:CDS:2 [Acaulospora colombiana]|uniref:6377_t:CDS:1 n=1 Tax=Acaulospora colombiana TaxID=27376 RepID=A0ACA9K898_9GLOM|nr:6377_t:CDS:2 [Acaulospora colombiana]
MRLIVIFAIFLNQFQDLWNKIQQQLSVNLLSSGSAAVAYEGANFTDDGAYFLVTVLEYTSGEGSVLRRVRDGLSLCSELASDLYVKQSALVRRIYNGLLPVASRRTALSSENCFHRAVTEYSHGYHTPAVISSLLVLEYFIYSQTKSFLTCCKRKADEPLIVKRH